jgi:hypothetical protein
MISFTCEGWVQPPRGESPGRATLVKTLFGCDRYGQA